MRIFCVHWHSCSEARPAQAPTEPGGSKTWFSTTVFVFPYFSTTFLEIGTVQLQL